jgi:hypothetical protein
MATLKWPTSGLVGMQESRGMLKFVGGRLKLRIQTWTERRYSSARDTVSRHNSATFRVCEHWQIREAEQELG